MLTLTFNTTIKEVKVVENDKIIYFFQNVPTVKFTEMGYYEVIQGNSEDNTRVPVARFPISNTIMLIEK